MNKLLMLGLAGLLSGCVEKYDGNMKEQPDANRNAAAYSDSRFFGEIGVQMYKEKIVAAKLLDYNQPVIMLRNTNSREQSGIFTYWLPTFQTAEGTKLFITSQPLGFVRGRRYNVEYWKINSGQDITENSFFQGVFNNDTYMVEFSKKLPKNIEGIITEISEVKEGEMK